MISDSHRAGERAGRAPRPTSTTANHPSSNAPLDITQGPVAETRTDSPAIEYPPNYPVASGPGHGELKGRAIEVTSDHNYLQFETIGNGAGTTIKTEPSYRQEKSRLALKCDGGDKWLNEELIREGEFLNLMHSAATGRRFLVPECHDVFRKGEADVWYKILNRLPWGTQAANALAIDLINPLPRASRRALMHSILPGMLGEAFAVKEANRHCLARPYLGRRGQVTRSDPHLRNFPMPVDLMEKLGLPVEAYAGAMAEALACMLFNAGIDGAGVEFVIAPPRSAPDGSPTNSPQVVFQSEALGPHALWLFDLDGCSRVDLSRAGLFEDSIDQAAKAFWANDPYYPRPCSGNKRDERLWSVFRERFRATGADLLVGKDHDTRNLPQKLVQKIEYQSGIPKSMASEAAKHDKEVRDH